MSGVCATRPHALRRPPRPRAHTIRYAAHSAREHDASPGDRPYLCRYGDQTQGRRASRSRPTHLEKGKYGPIFPKTPACYGFTIIANVKPGRADAMRGYGQRLAKALEADPTSSRRSSSTTCAGCSSTTTPGSCTRASSTPTSTSTPRTRSCCSGRRASTRSSRTSRASRWTGRPTRAAFVKFVREHQCPSFLEYGEYPYVTSDEIKKALKIKAALAEMLDQMQ